MQFRLLGPVAIRSGDTWLRPERPRRRAVLAYLLRAANRTVTMGELAEAIWGAVSPATARSQLQNDVAAIRKTLADAGQPASISTHTGGYELVTGIDSVDYLVFRRRVTAASVAARRADWPSATRDLRAGLDLWCGPALADVMADFVEPTRALWEEQRLDATELLAEAQVNQGAHEEQIPILRELVLRHPSRERPAALLMLALHRAGRRAEALAVARDLRTHLRDQHGLDPSELLVAMERRILRDNAIAAPVADRVPTHRPDQLPIDVQFLSGRDPHLTQLTDLANREEASRAVVITGHAGVGKTALAVRWGHQARASFVGGTLFINLRGYEQRRPVTPVEALRHALTGLGVRAEDMPTDLDDAAALYRSLTAKSRYLIVLDNARSADQVRPLLPGDRACFVIVTSRDSLPGLVASHNVARIELPLLSRTDGRQILERIVGAHRVRSEAVPRVAPPER
jgi:DNA-binding SARP family transcriptional activator